MNVSVLRSTQDSEALIANAARQCYSDAPVDTDDGVKSLIVRLIKDGHLSPLEHASITYQINGISRACSHQLVRHRIASYTQQSQRYVTLDEEPEWVIPPSCKRYARYPHELWSTWENYKSLIRDGVPLEDARYILPNATPTNIVATMNFRELLHFFELRCCKRAQWEIRELANRMLELAYTIAPNVFANAGAPCATCEQECPGGQ